MVNGNWTLSFPSDYQDTVSSPTINNLSDIFKSERFEPSSELYKAYESKITSILASLRDEGRKFGALLMEPVLLGAGGMVLV
jgi:bifunctional dethiobiotin synthetase / adenosylmethionine---8-amino-7-oxononanoate aminotransferase